MNGMLHSRNSVLRILLVLVLTLCIIASPIAAVFTAVGGNVYAENTGTTVKPPADLTISTAAELSAFAQAVNAGDDFSDKIVRLGADIDLAGATWTPIGRFAPIDNPVPAHAFAGTFDGDGRTISGLSITSGDSVALFGYLTGELSDLTVEGSVSGGETVAGVVAVLAGAVRGVTNRVRVFATGSYVGGIAADAAGTFLIADCINEGEIGNSSDTKSSGKLGGMIGRADTGTSGVIERCANTADITGYQYLAGIAGGIFGEVSVRTSYNTGKIEGKSFGKVYLGGIVGKLEGGTIDSCYNRGEIYGNRIDQSMGHIRAIGGIVGCEENHTVGTAITNVYQTGLIWFNATGMNPALDNHYIMMTGHISGGNSSTDVNTMTYENCFYEAGCYPQAEPLHPDYIFFRHEGGLSIWDTPYVTPATTDELRGAEILADLGAEFEADSENLNDGFPVLLWQNGVTDAPIRYYDVLSPIVLGGNASVVCSPTQAEEGETVSVQADSIETGKRIYRVIATDVAGSAVAVAPQQDGSYAFTMPGRNVRVEVILENDTAGGASYTLTMPDGLDGIWTVLTESSGAASATAYAAGSTVFVNVQKQPEALSSGLLGISVVQTSVGEGGDGSTEVLVATLKEGLYAFTMPAGNAAFTLNISYAPLSVFVQRGASQVPQALKTYSRQEMEVISENGIYYSGWSSETDPMIGRADTAVPLATLLADAGVTFAPGDILKIGSIDGMSLSYTYADLIGTPRYYYPGLLEGSAADRTPFEPILTICQNVILGSDGTGSEPPAGDTQNAYRFIFGQSERDFTNHTKVVDRLVKYVTSVTVVKAAVSGDIDGDGTLTVFDLVILLRSIVGLETLTDAQRLVADADGDNAVTVFDVVLHMRRLVGLD
ncbi:MAG: dockerin type I repeat-containing protein [Clostridiales Family XIII bacterium]|jgi:hypothetical protein|nr:dockerin type I repeat-containing protein [Clostridiales Family XIII bacterium]